MEYQFSKMMMIFPQIYRGYVDDPRNTDNAWMETVVMHFHDECGEKVIYSQIVTSKPAQSGTKYFRLGGFHSWLEVMLWPSVGWS